MADIEVEFVPTRVGGRRRRVPPVAVGLAILALIAVAVVKPWPSGPDRSTASASPAASIAAATTSPIPASPSTTPIAEVVEPAVVLAGPPRLGTWGVAFASDVAFVPDRPPDWTGWTELDPVADRPEPPIRDPQPMDTGCSGVPTVQASATVVALTVPDATPADYGIRGWWTSRGYTISLDGYLGRLDSPGLGPTAELARTDSEAWPDGRYEFHILTPHHVTALGFCLAVPPVNNPEQTTIDQIVHVLAARSGAWGVGDGGDGPRLIRDEPWTDWAPVDPGPAWGGSSLTLWPDTGLCMSAPILSSRPRQVAVTVPRGLVPDWRVTVWWQDGTGIRSLAGVVRQIAPPGNGAISYLERVDQAPWPVGRYEFDIQAGDHRSSMTACLGGR